MFLLNISRQVKKIIQIKLGTKIHYISVRSHCGVMIMVSTFLGAV
jgi:hypothetical protein